MKAYKDSFYAQVNVRDGRCDGYSFMIKSSENLDDEEVLERAKKAGCFSDDEDADGAGIVTDELFADDIVSMEDVTTEV